MSFESNTGINVSNHYGPRAVGGTVGAQTTDNGMRIYNIDLDVAFTERTPAVVTLPADVTVQDVIFHGTAGTAVISVGGVDVTAAEYATPIAVPAGGALTYAKGTGTGKVSVMTVTKIAG